MKSKTFILAILALTCLLSGCASKYQEPILGNYKLSGLSDIMYTGSQVRGTVNVTIDVENPAGVRYTLETMKLKLFNSDGTEFADAVLKSPVSVESKSNTTIVAPMGVILKDVSLSTAIGVFAGETLDFDNMYANLDAHVKAGRHERDFHQERIPAKTIINKFKK